MNGMLSFLLFAGALHVDWHEMQRGRWPILVLSTIGVLISTALIGSGFLLVSKWLGHPVPLIWCLVFGALISPTDPVAVMGVLKRTSVSPTLQATVAGESLFNDGVGVVVFSILLATATGSDAFSLSHALQLFAIEAGGGVVLGLAVGWIAFRAMRSIDDYNLEGMISLAVVMGGYALGNRIGVSGPVAMAVAGIIIGNHGVAEAMSETTRDYLPQVLVPCRLDPQHRSVPSDRPGGHHRVARGSAPRARRPCHPPRARRASLIGPASCWRPCARCFIWAPRPPLR